jgi:hypothetical protein
VTDDKLRPYSEHLEFFGYACETEPDGWLYAKHPVRWNFWLRRFEHGVRLQCTITLGLLSDARRRASLEFVNRVNEKSFHAKFTLEHEAPGDTYVVRARSVGPAQYVRREFGTWLDMWHKDLELLHEGPWLAEEDEQDEELEERPAAAVN